MYLCVCVCVSKCTCDSCVLMLYGCVAALCAPQWEQISSGVLWAALFYPLWGSGLPDYSVITTHLTWSSRQAGSEDRWIIGWRGLCCWLLCNDPLGQRHGRPFVLSGDSDATVCVLQWFVYCLSGYHTSCSLMEDWKRHLMDTEE